MKKQMDLNVMRNLENMSIEEARELAKAQLQMKKTSTKYHNILRDLDKAHTAREVERIMWNVMLAGEGMAMPGSAWQKLHSNT